MVIPRQNSQSTVSKPASPKTFSLQAAATTNRRRSVSQAKQPRPGGGPPEQDEDLEERAPDNLARLTNLTKDSVLQALQLRYDKKQIYTYLGDILVAINPYHKLHIYTEEMQMLYKGSVAKKLPPHIYAVADRAYDSLIRNKTPQCFVISGESGAGKTESTKYLLRHIVDLCRAGNTELEEMLLVVNPLLEAFGNAKTGLNDNSSRFGKYLELRLDGTGAIRGASLRHYLLEKSRVTQRNPNELNFHVFYQLYAGLRSENRLQDFFLIKPSLHAYLKGAGTPSDGAILGGGYMRDWRESITGLKKVGFADEDLLNIVGILAAILHLGDVAFAESANDSVKLVSSPELIKNAAQLMKVPPEVLKASLQLTHVFARGEMVQRNFNMAQAHENRDALSKTLYARLFSWIMQEINTAVGKDL